MSSGSQPRVDPVVVSEHGSAATARAQAPEVIATSNVVPFVRPQPAGAALTVNPSERPAPDLGQDGRGRIAGLLALSLVVHGALFVLFNREPEPLASIALPAISVEIVLGADTPAGVETTAQQQEVDTAANDPKQPPTEPETETAKQETPPEPESPPVETATTETPPAPPAPREPPPEPESQVAALPAEPTPEPRTPEPAASQQQPTDAAPTPPPPKPEPQPKPVQHHAPKPKHDHAAKPKQAEPRTRTANVDPGATASPSSSGIGIGRAGTDTNYAGRVLAHLGRYRQFPADARSRGEHGRAMVTFSLDGGGHVTRVSLVRSSGFSSLDQEAQAMVRRASPFPPPPDGRPKSFTAPASFQIQ